MTSRRWTIGELVSIGALQFGDGYRTRRSEHDHTGYRIVRVADILDDSVCLNGLDFVSSRYAGSIGIKAGKAGDILLTTKGTVGRVAIMPENEEKTVYSPQLCFFRVLDSDAVAPRFLRYWFSSPEFWSQANDRMNNTDMAAYINLADIRSLKLTLPALREQRAIVDVLGALDDKIAANTKLAEASENLVVTLLASQESTISLSAIVRHNKNSTLPESIDTGRVTHFSLPAFDVSRLPDIADPTTIKSSKYSIDQPSVLVSKLNPRFPRVWDIPEVPTMPALASTEFLVLEPLFSSSTFLWATLLQSKFGATLESKVAGTSGSHQRVKPADLLDTPVVDPRNVPENLRNQVTTIGARGAQARTENIILSATRDALLPQLMSGKLRVKDAETMVSAAL